MTLGDSDFVPILLGTGLNSYAVARSLHEAFGVRSLALGRFPLRETADSQIIDVRTYPDLDDPERLLHQLHEVAAEFAGRTLLLIANVEYYIKVVLEHRAELEKHFVIPLPSFDVARRVLDKADFYRTCEELGVPHPRTHVSTAADVAAGAAGNLPFDFPVVVKPSDTEVWGRMHFPGKNKVYLATDAQALARTAATIASAGYDGELILQEYLAGGDVQARVVNTYSDHTGTVRAIATARVVVADRNPRTLGNYNALATVRDGELEQSIRHLLDSIGYVGPANLDVIVDARTGQGKLLEVNLRVGAASYYATAAGVNLARCMVEDFVRGDVVTEQVGRERLLWLNMPRVALWLFGKGPVGTTGRAVHTLRYRADRSLARRVSAARVSWRHAVDLAKYGKGRGSASAF